MPLYKCPKCEKQVRTNTPDPVCFNETCGKVPLVVVPLLATDRGPTREKRIARVQNLKEQPPALRSPVLQKTTKHEGRSSQSSAPSTATTSQQQAIRYGTDGDCRGCTHNAEQYDHLPPLDSDDATYDMCFAIHQILEQRLRDAAQEERVAINRVTGKVDGLKGGGEAPLRGYMVGVLVMDGCAWVAMSGASTYESFKAVVREASLGDTWPVKKFVIATECNEGQRFTAGDAMINKEWMKELSQESPAALFECAAPKLIHAAITHLKRTNPRTSIRDLARGLVWNMTEMWVGLHQGQRRAGQPQRSCPNCIQVLPLQLCTLAPIAAPPKPKADEWQTVKSDKTKQKEKRMRKAGKKPPK